MIVGIDVAKSSFDAVLLVSDQRFHQVFANNAKGFTNLTSWLRQKGLEPVHACLEATGVYGEDLAEYLYAQGHTVSVVNPSRIKAYGLSRLSRNKTDKSDAALIALFCAREQPAPWSPAPPESKALQALVRRVEAVEMMRQQERNRLEVEKEPEVRTLIKAHVAYLDEQVEALEQRITTAINDSELLTTQVRLLTSIPGIAERTARKILAEVRMDLFEDAPSLAAYVGVTPKQHVSGSSVRKRPRMSKMGHAGLRKALYFPALRAMRCNPLIQQSCLRLQGKPKMVIVGAAMRKLVHLAYGVLKTGKPFDPNYLAHPQAA